MERFAVLFVESCFNDPESINRKRNKVQFGVNNELSQRRHSVKNLLSDTRQFVG